MLGEHAFGYVGGAGSCAGCGEATAIRMMVAATRQVHGPESMGIVAATGCNTVFGSTYPYNPYLVPWTNSLFENAPADAMGVRARWDQAGQPDRRLWVHRRRRRDVRHRLPVAVADGRLRRRHQGARPRHAGLLEHRRPGVDRLLRRAGHQALGVRHGSCTGGPSRARSSAGSSMAHGDAYVAQTTPAHLNHFYRAVMEANEYPGPGRRHRLHAVPARARHRRRRRRRARRKLAVDSRAFPLFTYDPRRGATHRRAAVAAGQPGAARRLGRGCPTASRSTSWRSPAPRAVSRRISRRRRGKPRDPSPRRPTGSPTGGPSRSWPASAR